METLDKRECSTIISVMKINFKNEEEVFADFCKKKGLKHSKKREEVLETFLGIKRHFSTYDLYEMMRKKGIKIGYSTVFRTMKLLVEAGIASAVDLGKGEIYFEHKWKRIHHDHLVCIKCGRIVEFLEPKIEELQNKIAKEKGFEVKSHRLVIYGLCSKCRKNG